MGSWISPPKVCYSAESEQEERWRSQNKIGGKKTSHLIMTLYGKGRAHSGKRKRKRVRRSLLDGGAICTMRRITVENVDVPFVFIRQWLLRRSKKKKKFFFGSQPSGGLAELEIYRRSSIPNQVNETLTQHLNNVSSFFFFFHVIKRIRHKIKIKKV